MLGADSAPARRQRIEFVSGRARVIEYRRHRIRCLLCRTLNRANWPVEANIGTFGASVSAVVAYLTGGLNLSHRETVEAMSELFKLKIGLGTVSVLQRRISKVLAEPFAQALEFVRQNASQCADETS